MAIAKRKQRLVALTTFHVSVGKDEDAGEYFVREGQKLPADHPAVKQAPSLFAEEEVDAA
jgi:hypothetical protein